MDPDATLQLIRESIESGDNESELEATSNLASWLRSGGFSPNWPNEVREYFVSALWSSNDESDESGGEPMDRNYDFDDIDPETVLSGAVDVFRFWNQAEKYLEFEGSYLGSSQWDSDEVWPHDFWLTRNGHGAGFWDGDWEHGDELTEICKQFPEVHLYIGDDGKIYA